MSERRLVAIMFTDIQGYTALMQQSEEEAIRFRDTHRKIFNRYTEEFNGEIIQYYGDGTLSIFNSAVDAVRCGIAMQLAFQDETDIPVRIGIHSGDIVLTEDDIIGDGVNVASRVESLAVSGSVFISEKVFDEIKNNTDIKTTYLDDFHFKNVKQRLGIYAISNEGLVVPSKKYLTGKLEKKRSITRWVIAAISILLLFGITWGTLEVFGEEKEQTIVLLPPKNYTGEEDLDYLVEGVHDLLYGDLCKVGEKLRVISPHTARALADAGKSISEMATEVNADYFLETSISCVEGDNMCINTRLVEFDTEERQVWTQEYFEKKGEILNFNNFLVNKIVDDINVQLSPDVERALTGSTPVDTAAIDLYLRGQLLLDEINPVALTKAGEYFSKAIAIEPEWAPPYAGMSIVLGAKMQMGLITPAAGIPKLHEYLPIALELDPNSSQAYFAKATSAVWAEWNWEKGEAAFLESLRRDPNDPLCRMFYAHLLSILRRDDEALRQAQIAEGLDPLRPFILGLHSVLLNRVAGDPEAALAKAEKALSIDPNHFFAKVSAMQALLSLEDYEGTFKYWKELNLPLWQKYGVQDLMERAFREQGWEGFMREAIRINEEVFAKDGFLNPMDQGFKYFTIGNYEKTWEYLEKAWDKHDPNMPYIATSLNYEQMKNHPEYIELLNKMKLPVE